MTTDITIPESTLRDVVAAQLASKFNDPEIIREFVKALLEVRVDGYGRLSNNVKDPSMLRWTIETTVRNFVAETAKAWLEDCHDELVSLIGKELSESKIIERIAKDTADRIIIR